MNRALPLLLLCALAPPASAEIYKWTDAKGRVHYGDQGMAPNAKVVNVQINSFKSVTYSSLKNPPARAVRRGDVTLYGTEWCGFCKKARRYLESNGIPYTYLDVEHDTQAKSEFKAIDGRGVPVILVGNRRMNGFSEEGLRRLLNP